MSVTLLKDVLIEKNKLDSYFVGSVPINLWRAVKKKSGNSVFDFIEAGFVLSNGRPRAADITIESRGEIKWVCVKERPRGLSTFDKEGLPKGKNWEYYKIPKGTTLPEGLAIVKDEYNDRYDATHYTIAPVSDMPLDQFKGWLDRLLKNIAKDVAV